jgi:hypothetical protein
MKTKIAASLMLLTLTIAVIAVAAYLMTAPTSPNVVVSDKEVLSQVTVSSISLTVGDELTLSTTVSDGTIGLPVTFFCIGDPDPIGTVNTDSTGKATITFTIDTAGTYSFYATATHP